MVTDLCHKKVKEWLLQMLRFLVLKQSQNQVTIWRNGFSVEFIFSFPCHKSKTIFHINSNKVPNSKLRPILQTKKPGNWSYSSSTVGCTNEAKFYGTPSRASLLPNGKKCFLHTSSKCWAVRNLLTKFLPKDLFHRPILPTYSLFHRLLNLSVLVFQ